MKPLPKGKILIGDSKEFPNPIEKRGWSIWIENGKYYTARTVNKKKFGGHSYDNGGYDRGIRDCICGCYMGNCNSSGPVDPFGSCPSNPLVKEKTNNAASDLSRR